MGLQGQICELKEEVAELDEYMLAQNGSHIKQDVSPSVSSLSSSSSSSLSTPTTVTNRPGEGKVVHHHHQHQAPPSKEQMFMSRFVIPMMGFWGSLFFSYKIAS